jgi:hypothetical protein
LDNHLIEHIEKTLKGDETGQKRRMVILELETARNAYVKAADRMEAIVKSFAANARELDVFVRILQKEEP